MKLSDLRSWTDYWQQLRVALLEPGVDTTLLESSLREAHMRMPVPVLWLLGKTQAGKTSMIRALTGSETAEIGNGFQPCTRSSRFYDFPADMPVVRFLDTRGLGEVSYDPADDIAYCEFRSHLAVAVMKVADINQSAVFEVLHAVRGRHPEWPVLIVQTGLHELYPQNCGHVLPWPYAGDPLPDTVPLDLRRALYAQRESLNRQQLPGHAPVHWVAIDLTLPGDGFVPPDYGLEALWREIELLLPLGLQHLLCGDREVHDLYARSAHPHITGYALAAACLGALPAVDLIAVTAVQAKLLHSLALLYGQQWDKNTITEFLGLMGAGIATGYLARLLGRTVVKLIPVWGQTAGAVWSAGSSGAATYALGKAAIYFFIRRRDGLNVDAEVLRRIYATELARGASVLKERLQGEFK